MAIREIIESHNSTDAELLTLLNTPSIKTVVNDGLVSLPMVAAVSEQLAGKLVVTLKRTVAALEAQVASLPDGAQKDATEGQLEVIRSFYVRLTESSYGAPIDSDSFRAQFAGIVSQAGWTAEEIDAFLSLGAVVESPAQVVLQRDAVQADVDAVRLTIELDAALTAITTKANAAQIAASQAREAGGATAQSITDAGLAAWGA